jgi:hypothetical protein
VNRHDIDPAVAEGFQHASHLRLQHGEIAVHERVVVRAANAAQVLTPIWAPIVWPCSLALRPMVTLTMPLET